MSEAIIFDVESTSNVKPEIIESSFAAIGFNENGDLFMETPLTQRFNPSGRISEGAMAVHHIMDEDLVNCPPSSTFALPEDVIYVVAHKVGFDLEAAEVTTGKSLAHIRRIDTLPIAKELLPECQGHTLGALTYHFFRDTARDALKEAHSAECDIKLLFNVLRELVKLSGLTSMEKLWEFSEAAKLPKVMPFGKHVGVKIADLPTDYIQWMIGKGDFEPDLLAAVKLALENRQALAPAIAVADQRISDATPSTPS